MCGIAGSVGGVPPSGDVLDRMAVAMAHRGPDGHGTWADAEAAFAFRRLAIIDRHERSDQPMHLGDLHLVFNGEIYNYRELRDELRGRGHEFVTEGDTEVLLHGWREWGEGVLDRLNGMFAFAVWDAGRRELTLARDPFGEKPLLWARSGDRLLFASDVRALIQADPALAAPREDVLGPFLALGAMPPVDGSFFAGVHRLPAAHVLRWHAGRADVRRYWTPGRVDVPERFEDAAALVRETLADSVRLRLRSDVPVGTSLSGGVDSSAVVGLWATLTGEHGGHAFTARFPGFARDEWAYASEVAQRAGVVEHHAVEPTAESLLDDLDDLVLAQEEPARSSSVYAQWRVMQAAHRAGITVLLDGQGADELFGGYAAAVGWALRSQGVGAVLGGLRRGELDRAGLVALAGVDRLGPITRQRRRAWASPYAQADVVRAAARIDPPRTARDGGSVLRARLLDQTFHTSLPRLLHYADRDSMAHSREVRLPFLDRRVAELAFSMPPAFLWRDGMSKAVLREAVRDVVPASVLDRRDKVGFETPQQRWLSEPAWIERIREVLLDPGARAAGLYDAAAIERDAAAGRWRDDNAVWRALNLEAWLQALASPVAVPAATR